MDRKVYERLEALQSDHWWFRGRRQILKNLLSQLGISKQTKILEAGVGTGGNLEMLSHLGEVSGFEHDEQALELAREKGDFPLSQGTLPGGKIDLEDNYDLVVAFDVIEHIEDDHASAVRLKEMLKPDGRFVMTVPAFPFLWSRHDETHHHFRRYTRAELNKKLEDAGYQVEYISYFNSLMFPVVVAVRFAKRLLGLKDVADDAMPSKPLNGILTKVFGFERHWVGRLAVPFGVSLVAVARKPA